MDIHGEGALVQHGPEISQSGRSVAMIQRGAEWQHLCWNGEGDSGRSGWGWQDIPNPEGQTERDSRSIRLQTGQADSPWILHRMEKKARLTGRCRQVLWREGALGPA